MPDKAIPDIVNFHVVDLLLLIIILADGYAIRVPHCFVSKRYN